MTSRRLAWTGAVAGTGAVAAILVWLGWPDGGDTRLRAFVHSKPPVDIVFTSRSGPESLVAAAPEGEGFTYPGQPLWQAREGRLRLLTTHGTVHELTWDKPLPGGKIIDVMSPSVSPDGSKILFAGRKAPPDPGHFRLYEINVDGTGLRQLTGGPNDPGCTAVPPMRYRSADDPTLLPDDERRRVDYDDVDPVALGPNGPVVFASTRNPDLGRGHSRRSTTLWVMNLDGSEMRPFTANRNNDRWPYLLSSGYIAFSLWSRNTEVITADERDVRPFEPGVPSATQPVNVWMAAFRQAYADHFGSLIKAPISIWRPRPLFNGRFAYMTPAEDGATGGDGRGALRVLQSVPGLLTNVPSASPAGKPLPRQRLHGLFAGPATDATGKPMSFATPSPCPPHAIVLAGAALDSPRDPVEPARYGIYLANDDWQSEDGKPVAASEVGVRLLFDDPELTDAEPVAVFPRDGRGRTPPPDLPDAYSGSMKLADGATYSGPRGTVFNSDLYVNLHKDLISQPTDIGARPIFDGPPLGAIDRIRIWASRRDRFDDPVMPRVPGAWELLVETKANDKSFGISVPANVPTVLAALDRGGRIVRWTTAAKDSAGRQATFFAFAGDHYSGMPPGGKSFCTGCHPGHSGLAQSDHNHAERLK